MKKSWFVLTLLLSLLLCAPSLASTISLGSLATDNIAVISYDPSSPSSSSIAVSNAPGSHINVTGNFVSPGTLGVDAAVTFAAGSGTTTPTSTEEADLASVVSQLNALSYTSLTINSGVVNTIGTAGNYTINGTLGAGTIINLTGSGTYVFTTGSNDLDFSNVIVNANSSLSSDNVFWYVQAQAEFAGGSLFGDVVMGGNPLLDAFSTATSTTVIGRILSEGVTTIIEASGGAAVTINDFQAATAPEPSTFAFLFLGLGGLAALRRRH